MISAAHICGISSSYTPSKNLEDNQDSKSDYNYRGAIDALNNLQNLSDEQKNMIKIEGKLRNTIRYLERSGINLDDLDKLNVIHVAGTKGKGSTCAYTQSILNSLELKTGLYTSPHLISVTERIRVNGLPISEEYFSKMFWKIYNKLNAQQGYEGDMPGYFKFLTILAFHVFLEENVDVAVVEVGIGGENDCTNIIRNTRTVGITSLGIDHVQQLGTTLAEIAWHKAGIIKLNSTVFTMPQPDECLEVIKDRVKEKQAKLYIIPNSLDYKWEKVPIIRKNNKVQNLNISLAIQLVYDHLKNTKVEILNQYFKELDSSKRIFEISKRISIALENCVWPGRNQVLPFHNLTIYLDGAHTTESLQLCVEWFVEMTKDNDRLKYLMFNATGHRDPTILLNTLSNYKAFFKTALFVPNVSYMNYSDSKSDNIYVQSYRKLMKKVEQNVKIWKKSTECEGNTQIFNSIFDAIKFLDDISFKESKVDLLVAGSLHLIGDTILALEEYSRQLST